MAARSHARLCLQVLLLSALLSVASGASACSMIPEWRYELLPTEFVFEGEVLGFVGPEGAPAGLEVQGNALSVAVSVRAGLKMPPAESVRILYPVVDGACQMHWPTKERLASSFPVGSAVHVVAEALDGDATLLFASPRWGAIIREENDAQPSILSTKCGEIRRFIYSRYQYWSFLSRIRALDSDDEVAGILCRLAECPEPMHLGRLPDVRICSEGIRVRVAECREKARAAGGS